MQFHLEGEGRAREGKTGTRRERERAATKCELLFSLLPLPVLRMVLVLPVVGKQGKVGKERKEARKEGRKVPPEKESSGSLPAALYLPSSLYLSLLLGCRVGALLPDCELFFFVFFFFVFFFLLLQSHCTRCFSCPHFSLALSPLGHTSAVARRLVRPTAGGGGGGSNPWRLLGLMHAKLPLNLRLSALCMCRW